MTPNEYRLIGMAQWVKYGRNNRIHNGDTLRIPYYPPIPETPNFNAVMSEAPVKDRHDYRRSVKRFVCDDVEYEIIEIEMQLYDGKEWEVIERWVTRS